MKFLKSPGFPVFAGVLLVILIAINILTGRKTAPLAAAGDEWRMPDTAAIPFLTNGARIAYGRALVIHTAYYLGPKGTVAHISNGLSCQGCHLQGGGRLFANPFTVTAAKFPQFSPRTGQIETLAGRINNCMQRSLNGKSLDTGSDEMKAIAAYIKWVGCEVPRGDVPMGLGTQKPAYLSRAASPAAGAVVFKSGCAACHGQNGGGLLSPGGSAYIYPPLWGPHSFNVSAGIYRIGKLAAFIKNNMPYGVTYKNPVLSNAQAWDVAAFIISQPRDKVLFPGDWPDAAKKPADYPFGPYADKYTALRHQFGPFKEMEK